MNKLRFYKLYDWILEELGASTDAALIAIIYSYEEMEKVCALSYTDFSEILKVNRRKAITRIMNLENAGYITVKKHTTQTNVYKVNRSAFAASDQNGTNTSDQNGTSTSDQNGTSTSDQNGTSYNSTSDQNGTSTSDQNGTSTSDQNGTSTSDQNGTPTIRENKRELKERERERPHNSQNDFISIPKHEAVKLTEQQYKRLQSEVQGTGRSLESYLYSLERCIKSKEKDYEPHNETLLDWIQRDKDERANKAAQQPRAAQHSSIDLDDVARLVNAF